MSDDSSDFLIHTVDHSGVEGHFAGLEFLLRRNQRGPGEGAVHFVRAEDLKMAGEVVGGTEIGHDRREGDFRESQLCHALVTPGADGLPPGIVSSFVLRNVFGKSMEREVRRGKGEVSEEWGVPVFVFVFGQEFKGAIGEFDGGVEIAAFFDRRERFVVKMVGPGIEKATLILEVIGAVEAGGDGHAVEVPFADVVGAVAGGFEKGGGEWSPDGAVSSLGALFSFDGVAADLLRVVAAEDGSTGGPTAGGVVEAGEAEAVLGEGVEIWCFDFGAVATEVGVAEIISQDEEDVGFLNSEQ